VKVKNLQTMRQSGELADYETVWRTCRLWDSLENKQEIKTYFCCFLCTAFSCSNSLIRCDSRTRSGELNTRQCWRSLGRWPFSLYSIWCSLKVTTMSNSFNFCCFSSYKACKEIFVT